MFSDVLIITLLPFLVAFVCLLGGACEGACYEFDTAFKKHPLISCGGCGGWQRRRSAAARGHGGRTDHDGRRKLRVDHRAV